MTTARLFFHDYKYFPYEYLLARREVELLFGKNVLDAKWGLTVPIGNKDLNGLKSLTYFKGVEVADKVIVPDQSRLEASAIAQEQIKFINISSFPSVRRQSTRYSAHGLHEYKGKFNPQVVRAIGNLIGLSPGDWVLDPFCGSGTTLLEASHIGWNAIGFDVNPLGVLIANAKVQAFMADSETLLRETACLIERLSNLRSMEADDWKSYLPNSHYLAQWFTIPVLCDLATIIRSIQCCKDRNLRDIFKVVLSDICRKVSLQDPEDLRIRRRKEPYPDFNAIADFCLTLESKVDTINRAKEYIRPRSAQQLAVYADSRIHSEEARRFIHSGKRLLVDAAITSPPYATALPYVDTQRLSLCVLGLINSSEIRATERDLIGNREISESEKLLLQLQITQNSSCLPDSVANFCKMLLKESDHEDHGFRRRNVPALIYKYFTEMATTFVAVRKMVRIGGHYALVVGGNKTNLQGAEIFIDTPLLLAEIAASLGWKVVEITNLETYRRYDMHQKNSIRSEVLLILQNISID